MAAVVAVVFHKYDVPPLAVNVVLCPLHIVLVPDIDAVGKVLTVTNWLLVDVHPLALVTVTV